MLKGFTIPKSQFGQAALTHPRRGTMQVMSWESSSGRTQMPRQRHCRVDSPRSEIKRSRAHDIHRLAVHCAGR
jgi:hypothetical protein